MISIDQMIDDLIKSEGGFVNRKSDRGGATKYGITIGTLSDWLRRPATVEDVRNLKIETAKEIYLKNYYLKPHINTLPEWLQPSVLDVCVMSGESKAVKMLQQALTNLGYNIGIIDGEIGDKTRTACEQSNKHELVNLYADMRISFYKFIVKRDPAQREYLNGWTNRANRFRV